MDNNVLPQVMCLKARARLTESSQFYLALPPIFIKEESECHFAISLIHIMIPHLFISLHFKDGEAEI